MYGIACHGEHFDDSNNLEIPYEFEKDSAISEINNKIYNLRWKMAGEYIANKNYNINDYEDLHYLDNLYTDMMAEMSYIMFKYGYTLNPENINQ